MPTDLFFRQVILGLLDKCATDSKRKAAWRIELLGSATRCYVRFLRADGQLPAGRFDVRRGPALIEIIERTA